jgi:hypothetical protein
MMSCRYVINGQPVLSAASCQLMLCIACILQVLCPGLGELVVVGLSKCTASPRMHGVNETLCLSSTLLIAEHVGRNLFLH